MVEINHSDFVRLLTFVQRNYGIDLSKKKQLIQSRLQTTLQNEGFADFTQYVDHIVSTKNYSDIETMLNKLTTNYTYFLREKEHFDFLKNTALPYLVSTKKTKSLNIWSAGCSSGEEPYTISMCVKDFLGSSAASWDTRVLATDISTNVMNIAKKGEYHVESLKDLPDAWKKRFFQKTADPEKVMVSNELKNNVIFRPFNLMDPIKFKTSFDIIFCRNVMIYFDQPTKDALIERFYNATVPGGYLMIGHSESVNRANSRYHYVMPATYRKPL